MPRGKPPSRELNFAVKRPTLNQFLAANAELDRTRIDFLKVDIETALTFSGIALQSENNLEKRRRNQENARRGYDTIQRLLKKVPLNPADSRMLSRNLKRLKSELQDLGETF
jgi:hypothetical protein